MKNFVGELRHTSINDLRLMVLGDQEISRSSHRRYSIKKSALRNFAKLTGKHLCQSLFFNKMAGLRPATSFELCEISKIFFFTENLLPTASQYQENLKIGLKHSLVLSLSFIN